MRTESEEEQREHLTKRYQQTLINAALGDTLGMPVEGWTREQIQKYTGGVTEPIQPFFVRDAQGNIIESDEYGKIYCCRHGLTKRRLD